ncbi:hypothetical protein TNCV_44571 [Trichonephila clavipes]|nr:hypothetical protein TNCV_44571 [Trichonephila clavipes]
MGTKITPITHFCRSSSSLLCFSWHDEIISWIKSYSCVNPPPINLFPCGLQHFDVDPAVFKMCKSTILRQAKARDSHMD